MHHAIVIEKADGNYSAHAPDLPGCVATGDTPQDAGDNMREAIRFHLEGLAEGGLPIPPAQSTVAYAEA
jgi:predicted RNase H-like HicB family nuclease